MAKFASIKIRDRKKVKPPTIHSLLHNNRLTADPTYLLAKEYRHDNYHLTKFSNATKVWKNWEQNIKIRYQKTHNRELRSDAITIEEGLIILSDEQVRKCSPDDIWKNAQEFKKWFEQRFNTEILSLDWHRDEGNEENAKVEYNEHVHFLFADVDMDGNKIRNKWTKVGTELSEMQDKIAEIFKPLGFIRGLKEGHKPYRNPAEQRIESAKKKVTKEKNATINQLKEASKKLRKELQVYKAERAEYREAEAKMKILKARIKAKDLTEAELRSSIEQLKSEAYKSILVRKKVGNKIVTLKKEQSYKKLYIDVHAELEETVVVLAKAEELVAQVILAKTTAEEEKDAADAKIAVLEAQAPDVVEIEKIVEVVKEVKVIKEVENKTRITELEDENTKLKETIGIQDVTIKEQTTKIEELKLFIKEIIPKSIKKALAFFKSIKITEIITVEEKTVTEEAEASLFPEATVANKKRSDDEVKNAWSNLIASDEMAGNLEDARTTNKF